MINVSYETMPLLTWQCVVVIPFESLFIDHFTHSVILGNFKGTVRNFPLCSFGSNQRNSLKVT